MTSKPVALLLADLGVTKTHARPHVQRQPVLGGAVQDAEVPPHVPRAVRLDPGRPGSLPRLFRLVQHPASAQQPCPADTCRCASRLGWATHRHARDRAGRGLRGAPGALPRRAPTAASVFSGSVDQPTQDAGRGPCQCDPKRAMVSAP
jgi:hypothetical protein